MANSSFTQKITLEGGDQIQKSLADIGKGGNAAFAQIQASGAQASQGFNSVQMVLNQLLGGLRSLGQDIPSAGGALGKTFDPLISAAESAFSVMTKPVAGFVAVALAAGGVSGAIGSMGNDAAASITKINDAALKVGTTLDTWRALAGGAKGIGLGDKDTSSFLEKLQELSREGAVDRIRKVVDLTRGIKTASAGDDEGDSGESKSKFGGIGDVVGAGAPLKPIYGPVVDPLKATGTAAEKSMETFRAWGIQLVDSAGKVRSSTELMGDVVRHLSGMGDSARRTEEAYLALGKSVGDTAIAFANDKKLFDETVSSVATASPTMEKGQIDLSEKIRATGSVISTVIDSWKQYVAAVAQPVALDHNNAVIDFLKRNRDAIKGFVDDVIGPSIRWLGQFNNALGAISISAGALGAAFGVLSPIAAAAFALIGVASIKYWEDAKSFATRVMNDIRAISRYDLTSWDGWSRAARLAWNEIALFAETAYQRIRAAALGAFPGITGIWQDVEDAARAVWTYLASTLESEMPSLKEGWKGFKTAALEAWDVIKPAAIAAWGAVKTAFTMILGVADQVANAINAVFGTHFTGLTLILTVALYNLVSSLIPIPGWVKAATIALTPFIAAFHLVASVVDRVVGWIRSLDDAIANSAAWKSFSSAIESVIGPMDRIKTAFSGLGLDIGLFFRALLSGDSNKIADAWDLLKLRAELIWESIKTKVTEVWHGIKSEIGGQIDWILSKFDQLMSAIERLKSMLGIGPSPSAAAGAATGADIAGAAKSSSSSAAGTPDPSVPDYSGVQRSWIPGHADGGHVTGSGTGTSDSILARLSNGEFIINAKTVAALGPRFFHALNNMELPGFAMGGLVMEPAFAGGGMVSALASSAASTSASPRRVGFSLDLFGQGFHGLSGPQETIDALERHASDLQMSSALKYKPSWDR